MSLKLGGSCGVDGISPEHVKYAVDSDIITHLCKVFTVCLRSGLMPINFCNGVLVPILKKLSSHPSDPRNNRPVIVSSILSKLIEMFILDLCSEFSFSDSQFGFVRGRSTNTTITLAHDVATYCNYNHFSVFMCALDAEGAFDGIPHPILFYKCMNVIPERCWKLLYNWYAKISVRIRWNVLVKILK